MSVDLRETCALGVSDDRLSALRDGALPADELRHLTVHAAACPACVERLERYERLGRLLRDQRLPGPTPALWDDVRASIQTRRPLSLRPRWRVAVVSPRLGAVGALAAALAVALLFGLVLHSLPNGATILATPTATSVPTATVSPTVTPASDGFPPFADWRAAYLAHDGRLHAVTLDGGTDLAGPVLPNLSFPGLNFASSGIDPTGHLVAYDAASGLTLLNVVDGTHRDTNLGGIYTMAWSPDDTMLAMGDNVGGFVIMPADGGPLVRVPPTPGYARDQGQGPWDLVGWIDASHLGVTLAADGPVVTVSPKESYGTAISFGALDIHTGDLRVVATISSPQIGSPAFSLSPDGSTALFYNHPYRDYPYAPIVETIDTATGAIHALPTIARTLAPGLYSLAWQAGAAASVAVTDEKLDCWLLDLHADTARHLLDGQFVAGWAPDNRTLVVSSSEQNVVGGATHSLSAVSVAPDGQVTTTELTQDAASFEFVGFVRTATT